MNTKQFAMIQTVLILAVITLIFLATACNTNQSPIPVEIREENGRFELYRDGKPYFIKGVGGWGHLDLLVSIGGNSVRTWGTGERTMALLDKAHEKGLSVCLGLDMQRERHGFDYNDEQAVAQQLERMRAEVLKYKDHPAVLMWGVGNELGLNYTNPQVWNAVNDVSKMIHDLDPHHPTTTMTAGVVEERMQEIKQRCTDLDLLAVNAYGSLARLTEDVRKTGWEKAYIVTEWGPTGHWAAPRTEWDVAIEETSTEKRKAYYKHYQQAIASDTSRCLGSYAFLWGQKQERTHTWYGMFMENGDPLEVIDAMQRNWTGEWPEHRSPSIDSVRLDGQQAIDDISVQPGEPVEAVVYSHAADSQSVQIEWEIYHESTDLKSGGDREGKPAKVENRFEQNHTVQARFKAPQQPGPYRIFVYIKDPDINRTATANIPFYVNQ
ncbi:MAG: glycoside hydrolase family 2 TIM barrel-domain containing protein [candidate division KSB1 bacterium]|nr:glycoside hydrolase family 2 TIM barrel-domain containing protein [candidate division KSB1 bacterium]